jgi:hypothetical protein
MRDYFIFQKQGLSPKFSKEISTGLIRLELIGTDNCAKAVSYFESEQLVTDLIELAEYIEKHGNPTKSHTSGFRKQETDRQQKPDGEGV